MNQTRPVVVLVGSPGSGKTTVGTALAALLGVGFRDTDADIERLAGKPIPEIFIDEGRRTSVPSNGPPPRRRWPPARGCSPSAAARCSRRRTGPP